jgi:uncharacterized protein YjeT (DUF2065 family)
MRDFGVAIGLALVIEGLPTAAFWASRLLL